MPEIPTCECVGELPPSERLAALYCAFKAIAEGGVGSSFSYVPGDSLADTTYSRATVGTFLDVSSIIQTAAIDVPRDGHYIDGDRTLLMEEARTNLCLQSSNLATAPWAVFSNGDGVLPVVVANAGVAPDGTTTAAKITVNRVSTDGVSESYQGLSSTVAGSYSVSCWYKAGSPADAGKTINHIFNTAAGYIFATVTLTLNWQRVELDGMVTAAAGIQLLCGYFPNSAGGTAGTGSVGFYAWGGQVEPGSFASSDIYTTVASVTRAIDALSFPDPGISGSWTQTETFIDLATGMQDQEITNSSGFAPIVLDVNRAYLSVTRASL